MIEYKNSFILIFFLFGLLFIGCSVSEYNGNNNNLLNTYKNVIGTDTLNVKDIEIFKSAKKSLIETNYKIDDSNINEGYIFASQEYKDYKGYVKVKISIKNNIIRYEGYSNGSIPIDALTNDEYLLFTMIRKDLELPNKIYWK